MTMAKEMTLKQRGYSDEALVEPLKTEETTMVKTRKKPVGRTAGTYTPTARQAMFAKYLMEGLKPADAALAAGYGNGKRKSANVIAGRLLKHPTVHAYMERYTGLPQGSLTKDIISAEIGLLAYGKPQGVFSYDHKLRALDLLLKAQGYVDAKFSGPQVQVNNVIANVERTARHVRWEE